MIDQQGFSGDYLDQLVVLYVEDEPLLREETATFIKRRVQKIYVASNGIEALELLDTYPINVVITDLLMPKMDGMMLSEEIRKRSEEIPIIITTAISDVSVMQDSIALGVERYLIKPIEPANLITALSKVAKKISEGPSRSGERALTVDAKMMAQLEADVAKCIKATTSKGAEKITCFLQANLAEIVIKGSRTKLEQTVLESKDNTRIVDFLRETYYKQMNEELVKVFKERLHCHAVLQQILCDSKRDVDIIKWILD